MEALDRFVMSFERYIDQLVFLPLLILVEGIIIAYSWSLLSKQIKSGLIFAFGFIVLSAFFGSIIANNVSGELPGILNLLAGGLIGGLLVLGASYLMDAIARVMVFIAGAVLPNMLLAHLGLFSPSMGLVPYIWIVLAVVAITGGIAMTKFSHTRICQIVSSAVGGAIIIAYMLMWSGGLSNTQMANTLNSGIKVLKNIANIHQGTLVILIAVSGVIVQSLLHLAFIRRRRRTLHTPQTPTTGQIHVSEEK